MIPVYQPFLSGREKEYVARCLESTWISSKGEFISQFEENFGEFIGAHHTTSVCNGTVALHLALTALGIGPGDEVIVPTLTYIASVNTIVHTGAKPVFVESRADTWQMDCADVERKISPRTKAVMAVHLYGYPCEMDTLVELCTKHELFLIEDAAEAFGTLYKGRHVGTFGDYGTFSFFGNKTITTGEGGMVVAKTPELIERAYHLKTQGVSPTREYWHDVVGFNYRMTNICAAIGVAQLEHVEEILDRKRRIADWYREDLAGLPLSFHDEREGIRHSYWMCTILIDFPSMRGALRDHLSRAGVETRPIFYPAHTLPPYAKGDSFPIAESISMRGLNLPSYPALSRTDVSQVCREICNFVRQSRAA